MKRVPESHSKKQDQKNPLTKLEIPLRLHGISTQRSNEYSNPGNEGIAGNAVFFQSSLRIFLTVGVLNKLGMIGISLHR